MEKLENIEFENKHVTKFKWAKYVKKKISISLFKCYESNFHLTLHTFKIYKNKKNASKKPVNTVNIIVLRV